MTLLLTLLRVVRPHIVAGGFLGYSLGALLALNGGLAFDPAAFVLGYAVVLLGDLSTHFSNDYFDVDLDEKASRKTFGGSNALAHDTGARGLALAVAAALSSSSIVAAAYMVLTMSFPQSLLFVAVVANALGWLYSAPPARLNSRGLGEATIALGTGLAVPAIGYMTISRSIDLDFLAFSAPLVIYGFILGLSLEVPDLEVDRDGGRRNLVTMIGRRRAALMIFTLSVSATALFVILNSTSHGSFWPLPLFSAVPVIASLKGFLSSPEDSLEADRMSVLNISALFTFLIAIDGYLLLSLL